MRIGGDPIDEDAAYVIAEAGVNHNGDPETAKELVEVAATAGADAVKFQTFDPERLVAERASKPGYQQTNEDDGESQREMLRRYELDRDSHEALQAHASERDIVFLSTPFDEESADFLAGLGVPAIKVGSGDLNNKPLLQHVATLGRPLVVSTGMGTMAEVERADDWLRAANPDVDVAFLHCTSAYPAPTEDVNLRAMQTMSRRLDVPIGYSDHTTSVEMPAFAVAAGARIVEKHFTLDKSLPGPDHEASLNPEELERSISLVADANVARGDSEKRPVDSERGNMTEIRRSLHAARSIAAGEQIAREMVTVLRPAAGLPPDRLEDAVGSSAKTELEPGDPITESDVHVRIDE